MLAAAFGEFLDPHPAAGNSFGKAVLPLSTGNVVVTSPNDDAGGTDAGAVYLFNGATGSLISTLIGSHASDHLGSGGITALTNGNFLVYSPSWNNSLGAVTWVNGTTGLSATVSASNSLVGTTQYDFGEDYFTPLPNGNFLIISVRWDNGAATDAGAVTWGSGTSGIAGTISATNSLVGSTANDDIGWNVTPLTNGNYVVTSPYWHNGAVASAGAVTWGSGTTGVVGVVSATNSLVGSHASDYVGYGGVTPLTNGNYVVSSPNWDNGASADVGAATWSSGTTGVVGAITSTNSLIGGSPGDMVSAGSGHSDGVTALTNSNYVVSSPSWKNGAAAYAGAATWGSGTAGVHGLVSATNSLVGNVSPTNALLNGFRITTLPNGNYIVDDPSWSSATLTDAGAVTLINGSTGLSGLITSTNSLVGAHAYDYIGNTSLGTISNNGSGISSGIVVLPSGNFVVVSPNWDSATMNDVGAVTWVNGATGLTGAVTATNSLVGSKGLDAIGTTTIYNSNSGAGAPGVTVLTNGNYVVSSPNWDSGTATDVGAMTWVSGTAGLTGAVSSANSLIGVNAGDEVGAGGVTALTNGNYVVDSPNWGNGTATNVGAWTWVNGSAAATGTITAANSLVGSSNNDGNSSVVVALTNGNYVVDSLGWTGGQQLGPLGAVTWGSGTAGVKGTISSVISLVGSKPQDNVGNISAGAPGVYPLSNGNYVVASPYWDNGAATDAGAVTWGDGTIGVQGAVNAANSLVGSNSSDKVGNNGVTALSNGNYVLTTPAWHNGALANAGALSFGNGATGMSGIISTANSVIGIAGNTSLGQPILDNGNKTFMGSFNENSGHVFVGLQGAGLVVGTFTADLTSGSLTITDSAGKDNQLSISVSSNTLLIADANELFKTVPTGATVSSDGKTISVPLASITGSITFNTSDGNDTLTLDLSGGNPFPTGGINFNGGNPTTSPGDKLVITGGNQGTVTYTYTNAHDGKIVMSNFGTLNYTGLEPINNSGSATDVVFNFPAATNYAALLDDGLGDGLTELSSGTFETTCFSNPSGTLTVNPGGAADAVAVYSLPNFTAGLTIGSKTLPFFNAYVAGSADVTLAPGKSLNVFSAGFSCNRGAINVSGGGAINITTDDIGLTADVPITTPPLNVGNGVVTIAPLSSGRNVVLGSYAGNSLWLSDSVLDCISGGTLRIGDSVFGGPVVITSPVNVANNITPIPTLHLLSHGAVINNSTTAPAVTATNLAIEGFSGTGTTTTLTTQASNLAASYVGGYDLKLSNSGDVTLTTVDGVTGVRSTGGGLTFSSTGAVTISASTGSNPGPTLITTAGTDKLLTIGSTLSGLGDLTLTADKMAINKTVNFGGANVSLLPYTSGTAINLGSTTDQTASTLELSNAELNQIVFANLQIGNSTASAITISADIQLPVINTTLVTSSGVAGSGAITNNSGGSQATLTINQSGNSTYSGVLGGPANGFAPYRNLALTKLGTGTLTLSGANTYSGDTTITAGTLKLGAANAIPSGSGKGNVVLNPAGGAAMLDINGFDASINGLSSAGSGASTVKNATSSLATLTVGSNDQSSTFSGAMLDNGTGSLALTKVGVGTLTLAGAESAGYTGPTNIDGGVLNVSGPLLLHGDVNVLSGATLRRAADLTLQGALNGPGTVDVPANSFVSVYGGGTFDGAIAPLSPPAIIKLLGPGKTFTVTGSGVNASLEVAFGTAIINGSLTGNVQIDSGATLAGVGTVSPYLVVGGDFSPGVNGAGTFTTTGGAYFQSSANFNVDIAGPTPGTQYDQHIVTGSVTLKSASLNIDLGFAPIPGAAFTIIKGASGISGTFNGLAEGTVFTAGQAASSGTFRITYQGGASGHDVVLTAIDPVSPVLQGTPGDDVFIVKRNGGNEDVSLNGTTIWSTPLNFLSTLTINGLAGNDALTADLSAGDLIPSGGLTFNGGMPTTSPGDKLVITGGDQGTVIYNYTNSHDGSILMSNYGGLNYTGLEPIVNTGSATDVVVNLPAGPNVVTLGDDGTSGNGLSRISASTIETTDFANPSGTLTITRGNSADAITLNAVPDFNAGLTLGAAAIPFSGLTFADALNLAADQSLTAYCSGTINLSNAASSVSTRGSGSVNLVASRVIVIAPSASITTVNGDITLSANQQTPKKTGNFTAIGINGTLTTTGSGNISLTGTAGDDATTASHRGVDINGGVVRSTSSAGDAGKITISGVGGAGTDHNSGVVVSAGDVESVAGNIQITGVAGNGSTTFNRGVAVLNGGTVKSTGTGASAAAINIVGTGGPGTDSNRGIEVFGAGSAVSTVDGDMTLNGTGGASTGSFNTGFIVFGGGQVVSSGTGASAGTISISGMAGGGSAGASNNSGTRIEGTGTSVTSVDGDITIVGSASPSVANTFPGVNLLSSAAIQIAGSGNLAMSGTAGVNGNQVGYALRLSSSIAVAGPSTTLRGDTMFLDAANLTLNAGTGTVLVQPLTGNKPIDLGTTNNSDPTKLGLSDANLDLITAGTLQIGAIDSGPITISADITRATKTDMALASGGAISFSGGLINTGGGNLSLSPGSAGVSFSHAGVDVNVGTSGNLSFASGTNLVMAINGPTADTQYDQLNVVGNIDLMGVNLALSGTLAHAIGNQFTLINNDGADAIAGSFANLSGNLLVIASGPQAGAYAVNYAGGDNNDLVLAAVNTPPTFAIGAIASGKDEDGITSIPSWATSILAGPSDESAQKLQFIVQTQIVTSTDGKPLFAVSPAIDPATGDLTFATAANVVGSAIVTVKLMDDGGIDNGGLDTSDIETFTIDVAKAHVWHNAVKPEDVNGDTHVAPNDLTALILFLNGYGATDVPKDGRGGGPYCDVDMDGVVAPKDIVDVIVYLNAYGASEGESSQPAATSPALARPSTDEVLGLLAADVAMQSTRRR